MVASGVWINVAVITRLSVNDGARRGWTHIVGAREAIARWRHDFDLIAHTGGQVVKVIIARLAVDICTRDRTADHLAGAIKEAHGDIVQPCIRAFVLDAVAIPIPPDVVTDGTEQHQTGVHIAAINALSPRNDWTDSNGLGSAAASGWVDVAVIASFRINDGTRGSWADVVGAGEAITCWWHDLDLVTCAFCQPGEVVIAGLTVGVCTRDGAADHLVGAIKKAHGDIVQPCIRAFVLDAIAIPIPPDIVTDGAVGRTVNDGWWRRANPLLRRYQ